ncbi:MAG: MFS transporter [Acidimicrobiales bacterium]
MSDRPPMAGSSPRRPARPVTWLTPLVQLGAFVIILGIPDGVFGVLWPSMRAAFRLPLDYLGLLTLASAAFYFSGGLIANQARVRLGAGNAMVASCGVALLGLGVWSGAPSWLLALVGVGVLGLSRGVIDALVNAEAALDGGVRRLGILHGSWAVGGTLGPLLVAAVLVWAHNWRVAVIVVAVAVLLLGPFALADRRVGRIEPPATRPVAQAGVGGGQFANGPDVSVGRSRRASRGRWHLALMIATFVAYTAAESGPIAWGYTYLISDRQASHTLAAIAMASFWAALTVGRFGLAVMDRRVAGTSILEASCLLMIAGTGLFWILPGSWAIAGLPIAGLGAAAVFPMLVALVPARMGEAATGRAVGASIAAASLAGPAAVALFGVLAAHLGLGVLGVCLFLSCVVLYALNRVLTLASAEGAT